MIHRHESKNRVAAGVLEGQGPEQREGSQAKRWWGPDGPTADGHSRRGGCGKERGEGEWGPVRSGHGERPGAGLGHSPRGEWGPDAGLWAIYSGW